MVEFNLDVISSYALHVVLLINESIAKTVTYWFHYIQIL